MAAIPQVVTDAIEAYATADEVYDGKVLALQEAHDVLTDKENEVIAASNAVVDAEAAVEAAREDKVVKLDELKTAIQVGFGD